MLVEANGLRLEALVDEPQGGCAAHVLLIMGLGGQLIHWPPALVQALVNAGLGVIRLDNRDAGLSTHLDHLGKPNLGWIATRAWLGARPRVPYTLTDMANDALGVLDALGVTRAHVVGLSMGAMIAQRVALAAPQRVLSLTSIMGASGARGLLKPKARVMRAAASKPLDTRRPGGDEALARYYLRFLSAISSPTFPPTEAELRAMFAETQRRRSPDSVATQRQLAAIVADGARAAQLGRIRVPTLVIHGREDPWVPLPCGEDTARRIPGARLAVIDDMAHDLAPVGHPELVRRVLAELLPFLAAHQPAAG